MSGRNPYVHDKATRLAKQRGYPARSVFKLAEIDRRVGLMRGVRRVLDLGAAPGSWSLYAAQRIGPEGVVVAVDQTPIDQHFPDSVRTVVGDVRQLALEVLAEFGPYDVVLSDMAPSTSGARSADQYRSYELFSCALGLAHTLGKPGSKFVGKLFMGGEFERARADLSAGYAEVKVIRAEATRSRSSELFLVGLGRR